MEHKTKEHYTKKWRCDKLAASVQTPHDTSVLGMLIHQKVRELEKTADTVTAERREEIAGHIMIAHAAHCSRSSYELRNRLLRLRYCGYRITFTFCHNP